MDAIQFYTSLLESNHITTKEGAIGLFPAGQNVPITVEGKLLVLPDAETLASYNDQQDEIQIFHPVSENVLRKDSPVFNFLKRLYRTALSVDFENIAKDLINLANNPEISTKCNKEQRKILEKLPEMDEKSLKAFETVLSRVNPNGDNKLIDITVSRGESINNEKFARVAYLHFPLYRDLLTGETSPFGAKVRKKDIQAIIALHEIVFGISPESLKKETDIADELGSNSGFAPNFDSLTQMYTKVKEHLIKVHGIFGSKFNPLADGHVNYKEGLGKIDVYRALIPSFPGNDGEPVASAREDRKTLREAPKVRVTALGTRREIPSNDIPEEKLTQPMTYEEIRKRQAELQANIREERSSGRYARRRDEDIDISHIDPEYGHASRDERYARDRYEDRYASRYSRDRYDDRDYRRGADRYSRHPQGNFRYLRR